MEDKLKEIFNNIFRLNPSDINDETSIDNVQTWDSLSHMQLILSLEEEFSLSFVPEEIIEMTSFKKIKQIIFSKKN